MVIKEFCKRHCVIREDNYNSQLGKFLRLFEEAKKDFPNLTPDLVKVVMYGGIRYKRTMGIEFVAPDDIQIPESYQQIHSPEYTM